MGQDAEEAAEFVATVRRDHIRMKEWYSQEGGSLHAKYGPYPGLWKEVLNWKGWKEARKEFLKHQQQQERKSLAEESIPRKRKSRWGRLEDDEMVPDDSRNNNNNNNNNNIDPVVLPALPTNLPPHKQQQFLQLQAQLRNLNAKLDQVEQEAARVDSLPRGHRDRSPSPPPVYGPDGKRQNTRAVRWKHRWNTQRQDLLERILALNPQTRRTTGNILNRKRTAKVPIPIDKHPTYNFIGLLIGPRGKTQKELETKTGCKIAIRGRGSIKEGARGRRDGRATEGENDPLHVLITGEHQAAVEAAAKLIEDMLIVIDDEKNVHKQQQLRELALLNGTLKEQEFCPICAEKGHRAFECPKRFATADVAKQRQPLVKCAICGDTSHPTRDCRSATAHTGLSLSTTGGTVAPVNSKELDSDYMNFMAEIDGKQQQQQQQPQDTAVGVPPPPLELPPMVTNPMMAPPLPPPPPASHLPPPPPPPDFARTPGKPPFPQPPQQQQYPPYDPFHYPAAAAPVVRPGEETTGWDPQAYYNHPSSSANGNTTMNWWEQ